MIPRSAPRAGALAVVALAAGLLLQACSSEPTTPRSFASSATTSAVTSTSATPTTTTSAPPTTTTSVVVPVVPAQVPLPTTRVAVKTVAPQGLVAPPATKKQAADPGTSGGGGAVYYKNCTEVRNAGKAPIRRGQPGYASHLDGDGDGVGCEK